MFASEMAEKRQERVTLNGVEPAMINLIIQYAYTSEINITKANVQSLLSAANLLQVRVQEEEDEYAIEVGRKK